ncbi:MAG: hypothetical protein ACRDZX_01145 [Acidimicrobiales bacterium]
MPRQNRVTPHGELIAVADRGMFWGNRGCLHDGEGHLVRYSRGQAWAICVLEFKGRRRQLWAPGKLTELFFLDEATGLAAGHRPCGECRSTDYRAFKAAWATAYPREQASARAIDARLHVDRLARPGVKRTYRAPLNTLPNGTMVDIGGRAWLVVGGELVAWSPGGYDQRRPRPGAGELTVLTPRATVATLTAGYQPKLHPTVVEGRPLGDALGADAPSSLSVADNQARSSRSVAGAKCPEHAE